MPTPTDRRAPWPALLAALATLAAVAALLAAAPAGAQSDDDDEDVDEPTTQIQLDIHDEVPRSTYSPLGAITTLVHGGERAGQTATASEIDAEAAETAERSLEELGAERTPDGLVVTLPETILFDFDSAELLDGSDEVVDRVAELLEFYEGIEVEVRGHTDDVGDEAYNVRLSEQRAEAVVDALVDAGASRTQLSAVGFGWSSPVAPNDSDDGRQQNRRVEIVLRDA